MKQLARCFTKYQYLHICVEPKALEDRSCKSTSYKLLWVYCWWLQSMSTALYGNQRLHSWVKTSLCSSKFTCLTKTKWSQLFFHVIVVVGPPISPRPAISSATMPCGPETIRIATWREVCFNCTNLNQLIDYVLFLSSTFVFACHTFKLWTNLQTWNASDVCLLSTSWIHPILPYPCHIFPPVWSHPPSKRTHLHQSQEHRW